MSELFDNLSRRLASPMPRRQTLRLIISTALTAGFLGLLHRRVVAQSPCGSTAWECAPFICCAKAFNCCVDALGVAKCCPPPQICCDGVCRPGARLCPKEKLRIKKLATKFNGLGVAIGTVGGILVTFGGLPSAAGFIVLATGAISGMYGIKLGDVAENQPDPNFKKIADPNFKKIAKPVTRSLRIQPITTADGFTQQSADALNALLKNLEKSAGLGRAIFISLNRADGARNAGDEFWELQQLEAAQKYSLQLGELTDAQPQLFANFANAYTLSTLPRVQLTKANMLAFQKQLRTNGLPPEFTQTLTDLGADRAMQGKILQNLIGVDPKEVMALAGEFPNQFTKSSFKTTFRDTAQAFKEVMLVGKIDPE